MAAAIKLKVKVDVSRFKAAFAKLNGEEKKKIMDKVVRTDAMGFVRDVVAITPPGHQKAPLKSGNAGGIVAGRNAILRDLTGGKSRVGVFNILSDGLIDHAIETGIHSNSVRLFVKKDGSVYGCERANFKPDASNEELYDHHRRYFKRGRMSQAGITTRDIGRWKFIDKLVIRKSAFERYLNYVYEKIGILAGGWAGAAKKLKVRLPKEVNRHASGDCQIILGAHSCIGKIIQPVSYGTEADINPRVAWVLDSNKRVNRMQTRIKFEIEAAAKRLGISL